MRVCGSIWAGRPQRSLRPAALRPCALRSEQFGRNTCEACPRLHGEIVEVDSDADTSGRSEAVRDGQLAAGR